MLKTPRAELSIESAGRSYPYIVQKKLAAHMMPMGRAIQLAASMSDGFVFVIMRYAKECAKLRNNNINNV